MRTKVELPDELLTRARKRAAREGLSLNEFFIEAIEQRLAPRKTKVRRPPPTVGRPDGPRIRILGPEQVDEAMFG